MKTEMAGFALTVLSMVGLGVGSFLYKRSTARIGAVNTTFFYFVFGTLAASVVWLFLREKEAIAMRQLLWPSLTALSIFLSVLAFNLAVDRVEVSIASTIRALAFLITVALSVVVYDEQLYLKDYVGIALAALAVLLLGIEPRS